MVENKRSLFDWRAKSFVLNRGKNGKEHAYCYCAKHFKFVASHTDDKPNVVEIPAIVAARCRNMHERISFHHNHPALTPLSHGDLELLGRFPGLLEISAHTALGASFRASRAKRWKSSWTRRFETLDAAFTFQSLSLQALPGFIGPLEMHTFNMILARARLIEYDFRLDANLKSLYDCHRILVDQMVKDIAELGRGG